MVGYLFQFRIFIIIQLERKGPLLFFGSYDSLFVFDLWSLYSVLGGGHLRLVIKGFSVIFEYFVLGNLITLRYLNANSRTTTNNYFHSK